mgnify:CR=1 FL=1
MTITEYEDKVVVTGNESNPDAPTHVEIINKGDYSPWESMSYNSAIERAVANAYDAEK